MVPQDLTAYYVSISPHVTSQLKLQERTVSTLKSLRYDNESSRTSAALALKGIQAEFGRLAPTVISVRVPVRLAQASAAHVKAIQQFGSAVGELADALKSEPKTRVKSIERARVLAREAEVSARHSAALASAATAVAAATFPPFGLLIQAVLAEAAAVVALIGQIAAKGNEEEAAERERERKIGGKRHHTP